MYKIYQVDAFTDKLFSGNPAAVCPLDSWLRDDLLQKIAMENNLAETAFYVKQNNEYKIRWFTPAVEVALCGHATLAAAFVIFNYENYEGDKIVFNTRESGKLIVSKENDLLILDFPSDILVEAEIDQRIIDCFDMKPDRIFRGKSDYLFIYENESKIKGIKPDLKMISQLDCRGVIISAKGDHSDFVSRFFAPQSGIDEDPVTGSAHTSLIPFWADILGKNILNAIQLSPRKGFLECENLGERVRIKGKGRLYMRGEIFPER